MSVCATSGWPTTDRERTHDPALLEKGYVLQRILVGRIRLALRLGLFQLSLGILGVLILGLLNRLLIHDIQLLAALAVSGQQLMGFTRAWFGHRFDRIPLSRLRRTPFIVIS